MTNVTRALEDIATIRNQIAASQLFRGFGPAVVAATGVLALIAALWQSRQTGTAYFPLWIALAGVSVAMIGAEMWALSRRHHGPQALPQIWTTVEKFLPIAIAGASIGAVLGRFAPESLWILPGLWQVLIALGLFAAASSLPLLVRVAAVWYFVAGLIVLIMASAAPLSPWMMGLPFGVGQCLVAAALQFPMGRK